VLNTYGAHELQSDERMSDERNGPELCAKSELTVQSWSIVLLRRIS
jgi:hypothetical protein